MHVVVDEDHNILMWSADTQPTAEDGQMAVALNDKQAEALLEATQTPNGGLTLKRGKVAAKPVPPPPPPPPNPNEALIAAIKESPDWPTAQAKLVELLEAAPTPIGA